MTSHDLHHLFSDDLEICFCGNPEHAVDLVRQILNLCPLHTDRRWEQAEKLVGHPGAYHIVLSDLTEARLIEHGGSIGGSWLTDKGKAARDALNALYEADPEYDPIVGCEWYEHIPADCEICHPKEERQ